MIVIGRGQWCPILRSEQVANRVAAGEALVFHPNGKAEPDLVARIKIEEWPKLASSP